MDCHRLTLKAKVHPTENAAQEMTMTLTTDAGCENDFLNFEPLGFAGEETYSTAAALDDEDDLEDDEELDEDEEDEDDLEDDDLDDEEDDLDDDEEDDDVDDEDLDDDDDDDEDDDEEDA
jgi:hypothetical protein